MCSYNTLCCIPFLYISIAVHCCGAVYCLDRIKHKGCFRYGLYKRKDNLPCVFQQEKCCTLLKVPHTKVFSWYTWLNSHIPNLHSLSSLGQLGRLFIHWQFHCNINSLLPTGEHTLYGNVLYCSNTLEYRIHIRVTLYDNNTLQWHTNIRLTLYCDYCSKTLQQRTHYSNAYCTVL